MPDKKQVILMLGNCTSPLSLILYFVAQFVKHVNEVSHLSQDCILE